MEETPRVLIVAPSSIGDVVMSEALIARLLDHYPDMLIDVLASPRCAPIYERIKGVHCIIANPIPDYHLALSHRLALAQTLMPSRYTRAMVLSDKWKTALVPFFAKIPNRTGLSRAWRYPLINDVRAIRPYAVSRDVLRSSLDAKTSPNTPLFIPKFLSSAKQQLNARRNFHLTYDAPLAILCPAIFSGDFSHGHLACYSTIAKYLARRGLTVLLVGEARDLPHAIAIETAAGKNPAIRNLAGKAEFAQTIDLMASAHVVISGESEWTHIAAAVDVPLVALLSLDLPHEFVPLPNENVWIAQMRFEREDRFQLDLPRVEAEANSAHPKDVLRYLDHLLHFNPLSRLSANFG